ncbi:hypothetical protein MVEN_01438200 [Mycena venus]|uniref:Uncharacterized protein n=1 Tax=Mycena venus TaxID=2733690 RepID=A0A8H6XZE7_9AGAR|nr:hypothetical protein MVEN_01438200 [Mycena venus]
MPVCARLDLAQASDRTGLFEKTLNPSQTFPRHTGNLGKTGNIPHNLTDFSLGLIADPVVSASFFLSTTISSPLLPSPTLALANIGATEAPHVVAQFATFNCNAEVAKPITDELQSIIIGAVSQVSILAGSLVSTILSTANGASPPRKPPSSSLPVSLTSSTSPAPVPQAQLSGPLVTDVTVTSVYLSPPSARSMLIFPSSFLVFVSYSTALGPPLTAIAPLVNGLFADIL